MSKSVPGTEMLENAGFAVGLIKQARLIWRLLRDRRVPGWVKLIPLAALVYFLSPIDLMPDLVLPGLGEVDDVVVILLALKAFVDLSPHGVVREHLEKLVFRQAAGEPPSGACIEVPYRIIDQE